MDDKQKPVTFFGIDWSDGKHDVYTIDQQGNGLVSQIDNTPEAIEEWLQEQLKQAGDRPIAIMIEAFRGALFYSLMGRERVLLYAVNPKQAARYRESYSNAGCKADKSDARLLARMLRERITLLKPWVPDDVCTRLIAGFAELRRNLVDERTKLALRLLSLVKAFFPGILQVSGNGKTLNPLAIELLQRWPNQTSLKKADRRLLVTIFKKHRIYNTERQDKLIKCLRQAQPPTTDEAVILPASVRAKMIAKQFNALTKTINDLDQKIAAEMERHPDANLFKEVPGAGAALAPRLLTAFGSNRDRYRDSTEVAVVVGIAPVLRQSGKSQIIQRRIACSHFLRQTFHEFANSARIWCPWSKAYYEMQRSRKVKHNAALRKLAYRWIRILFVVWKRKTPYDPNRYMETLRRKNPAIIPFLENSQKTKAID